MKEHTTRDVLAALNEHNKQAKNETVIVGTVDEVELTVPQRQPIPTGIPQLDYKIFGVGGIPRNRSTEIFGPEGGGKTTLALQACAAVQQAGGTAAYIDTEAALDREYANALGVDTTKLIYILPSAGGEEALDQAVIILKEGLVDLLVLDSLATVTPTAEFDAPHSEMQMGLQARLLAKFARKVKIHLRLSGTALICINQNRASIGGSQYVTETQAGGRTIRFFADVRLDLRRKSKLQTADGVYGQVVKIVAHKNKLTAPFQTVELDMYYGTGIDKVAAVVAAALEVGLLSRSGASYRYNGEKFAVGISKVRAALLADNKLLVKLTKGVEKEWKKT